MFRLQSETRAEQTALIDEMVGNQKIVQAFSHEDEDWNSLMRLMNGCRTVLCVQLLFFIDKSVYPFCQ